MDFARELYKRIPPEQNTVGSMASINSSSDSGVSLNNVLETTINDIINPSSKQNNNADTSLYEDFYYFDRFKKRAGKLENTAKCAFKNKSYLHV